jgi:hypothetical protein
MNLEVSELVGVGDALNLDVEPSADTGRRKVLSKRLSTEEKKSLKRCEKIIDRGAAEFLRVGLALREIRDRRLYRELRSKHIASVDSILDALTDIV